MLHAPAFSCLCTQGDLVFGTRAVGNHTNHTVAEASAAQVPSDSTDDEDTDSFGNNTKPPFRSAFVLDMALATQSVTDSACLFGYVGVHAAALYAHAAAVVTRPP